MTDTSDTDSPGTAWAPGHTLLGRYRVERPLGHGGMGEVYLALDELLKRRVALKRVRQGHDRSAEHRAAMLREARRASQINDPRIAAIYDVIEHGDEIVLVMEFVEGVTLRQHIRDSPGLAGFWKLAVPCAEALAVAHRHGVIHRDIKPENFMVTGAGDIKILDFGIARRTRDAGEPSTTFTDTRSEQVTGTPQYMAPEAHLGGAIDARADIFSLGVVFYEWLAEVRPFEGTTYAAIAHQVLSATPRPVRELNPAVDPALSRAVSTMLAKDPAQRFATADEVVANLTAAHAGVAPPARARPRTPRRPMNRWAIAVPLVVIVAAVLGLVLRDRAGGAALRDRNLAILPAETPGATAEFASFAGGFIDVLDTRLRHHIDTPGFQIADLQDIQDEHVRTAADARKVLGASLALRSTLEQTPDRLRVRLDLLDTESGRVVGSRTTESALTQPFDFLDRGYRAAAELLQLTPNAAPGAAAIGVRGAGTLRLYLQGLGLLQAITDTAGAAAAVSTFGRACMTDPETAVAHAGLAEAYRRLHYHGAADSRLEAAIAAARTAVRIDSTRPEAHRALARALAQATRTPESVAEFERVAALDPTDDEAFYRVGRGYARMKQPERERAVYVDVARRRPHSFRPHWWLAVALFRASRVDESIQSYRDMIRCAPLFYKGYSGLGGLLVLRGDYPRGIEALQHSITLRPTLQAFNDLGTAFFNARRFPEAVDAYNQSFQFGNDDYESWLNLGDAQWALDRKPQALQAYGEGVRLGREKLATLSRQGHSFDVRIPAHLASVFPRLAQPDSARAYLARAVAADSTNPMVSYWAALTCWQLQDRSGALDWLERSVRGGYPVVWLRDSPVFDEWRGLPAFGALVASAEVSQQQHTTNKRRPS